MNEQINDGGSVFPQPTSDCSSSFLRGNLTMRDYFAGQALQGLLARQASEKNRASSLITCENNSIKEYDLLAGFAYLFADAMLTAREKGVK